MQQAAQAQNLAGKTISGKTTNSAACYQGESTQSRDVRAETNYTRTHTQRVVKQGLPLELVTDLELPHCYRANDSLSTSLTHSHTLLLHQASKNSCHSAEEELSSIHWPCAGDGVSGQ